MKYHIITIEREYASAGREIAEKLANNLAIAQYSTEILHMAAQQLGTSVEHLEHLEETATSSLLYSLYMLSGATANIHSGTPTEKLHVVEADIIRRLAKQGPAVIVGRCASHILRERSDVLRVFIRANMEQRAERARQVYGVDAAQLLQKLKQIDKRRENFYNASTGKKWRDSANYDLVLDSGTLGVQRCVEILETCVK